ncbi:unnamed protein product [Gongylonema pulchrum]|uniref:Phosphatase 2A Regulatory Subunit A helical domain-containing protein n=1 Tax=Gongylonema pulchrum TaxID=637853 RepID=A0A3P7RHH2_9BILA|nr:unnamed protein product [Gongylonema pulchrum]
MMIQYIQEQMPKEMRRLIGLMLHRNPAKRPQASSLLQKYAPYLFPPVFDFFLYKYMSAFRPKYVQTSVSLEEPQTFITMDSDDVIAKLASDLDLIMEKLSEKPLVDGKPIDQTPVALLVVALITSNMRALKSQTTKFEAMKLLHKFVPIMGASVVADRILPYMVCFLAHFVFFFLFFCILL